MTNLIHEYFSMSKKKKTLTITGAGFSTTSALSANDIENLSVDGFGNPSETLFTRYQLER